MLSKNYRGTYTGKKGEEWRQFFIHKIPKFGNDNDFVDHIAHDVANLFCKEILKHKEMLPFLFLGAAGLAGTVIFHSFERIDIVYEVTEEAFKIVGVSFFLAAYFTVLETFIKKLYIYLPAKNEDFTEN